jgi:hypothetical protein
MYKMRACEGDGSPHDRGQAMSVARAERRRAKREAARRPSNEPPHGGAFGGLDDGRWWRVIFPTTQQAERFLQLLGPPPASEARLRAALKDLAGFHSLALH